jgi:alkane 1-monooxygenase
MNAQATAIAWHDRKRYLWLLSPLLPCLNMSALIMFASTGWGVFLWLAPILLGAVIPLFDWLIGDDASNPPESAVAQLENDRYYRAIVFAYIPMQYLVTAFGAWIAVRGNLPAWEWIGLVISVGIVNGIGINTAHELSHKKDALERWLAKIALAPVAYGHFFVEHTRGHHKNVATPGDPASAKMGESFWRFLPRTLIGSVCSAWRIERERLARKKLSVWSIENDNFQAWAMTVMLFVALTVWLGWRALPFLLLQAFSGAALLEVINYLEHYGLLRQRDALGRYARCTPADSWNSNHVVTNLFLYQLQRHSDHHANPVRRFQALRHCADSPQLPSGYASMIVVAIFPPLWFWLMDPRLVKHYQGHIGRANMLESKREVLLQRYTSDKSQIEPNELSLQTASPYLPSPPQESVRYRCTDCGFIYDEREGCQREGFLPGTPWAKIPEAWSCPDCAVRDKVDFEIIG